MTNNQINYLNLQETRRANRAKEDISAQTLSESSRHNKRSEEESERSNRAREYENERSNRARESFNILNLAETHRANTAKEEETNRSNSEKEKETNRHNKWTEALDYSKQVGMPFVFTPGMVESNTALKDSLYSPAVDQITGWFQGKIPGYWNGNNSVRPFLPGTTRTYPSGSTFGGGGGKW